MTLKERLSSDIKESMKTKNATRLSVLRLISAAVKQVEVDTRKDLNDTDITEILSKMKKQRMDSIDQYIKASREDLADQERFEIGIVDEYLPQPLNPEDLRSLVHAAISEVGAETQRDLGKVVSHLRPQILGRADMNEVVDIIKKILS